MNCDTKAWSAVTCDCGWRITDGQYLKARAIKLLPDGSLDAKCRRCSQWHIVKQPLETKGADV